MKQRRALEISPPYSSGYGTFLLFGSVSSTSAGGGMFFEPWVLHRSRISASIATHLCSDVLCMKCVDF